MKYIFLSTEHPTQNIDHALNILRGAIREAIHLDRTLVVGTFSIDADGNLGHALQNLNYGQFIDLDKTQICGISDSDITDLKESFHHTYIEDFDLKAYPNNEILSIEDNEAITAEQNQSYKVVIRKTTQDEYANNYPNTLVRFFPSAEVDRLTDIVLKAMGTNLEEVKKRATIYYGADFSSNQDYFQKPAPPHPAYYQCVHIPYTKHPTPEQLYITDLRQIKENLKRFGGKDNTVYIISNISDTNYFKTLKKHYTVYQYHDFPELKALVSGDNQQPINNALLHSVEKNILELAALKMIPFENLSGLPIIYSNSSHKIPWRYRLAAWRGSLSSKFFSKN